MGVVHDSQNFTRFPFSLPFCLLGRKWNGTFYKRRENFLELIYSFSSSERNPSFPRLEGYLLSILIIVSEPNPDTHGYWKLVHYLAWRRTLSLSWWHPIMTQWHCKVLSSFVFVLQSPKWVKIPAKLPRNVFKQLFQMVFRLGNVPFTQFGMG